MKFLLLILVSSCSLVVQAAPKGDELYTKYCASCHGNDGKGGVGVPLALPSFINSVSDEFLKKSVRYGRPGRIMPAFSNLSDAQVDALVQHLRGWSDKPAPLESTELVKGNSARGQVQFAKHCVECHGNEGKGGSGTGVTFSRKRNLPIVAPALNNSGFLAAASDTMIRDTIIFGREGTPMTSMLVAGLSEQDIDDVVAYIRDFEKSANKVKQDLDERENDSPAIIMDSPYALDETIENLKQAITDQNFTLIRTEYLEHGLVQEGTENKKQLVLHFCNFDFLFKAISIDPRVGMFLPCRITVIEKDNKVQVSAINPRRLSQLFNNHELDTYCNDMYDVYYSLLEDATL